MCELCVSSNNSSVLSQVIQGVINQNFPLRHMVTDLFVTVGRNYGLHCLSILKNTGNSGNF